MIDILLVSRGRRSNNCLNISEHTWKMARGKWSAVETHTIHTFFTETGLHSKVERNEERGKFSSRRNLREREREGRRRKGRIVNRRCQKLICVSLVQFTDRSFFSLWHLISSSTTRIRSTLQLSFLFFLLSPLLVFFSLSLSLSSHSFLLMERNSLKLKNTFKGGTRYRFLQNGSDQFCDLLFLPPSCDLSPSFYLFPFPFLFLSILAFDHTLRSGRLR